VVNKKALDIEGFFSNMTEREFYSGQNSLWAASPAEMMIVHARRTKKLGAFSLTNANTSLHAAHLEQNQLFWVIDREAFFILTLLCR
jgi:hypothetical protein